MVISFSIYLGALNKDEFWRWNAAQEDGEWRPGLMETRFAEHDHLVRWLFIFTTN